MKHGAAATAETKDGCKREGPTKVKALHTCTFLYAHAALFSTSIMAVTGNSASEIYWLA